MEMCTNPGRKHLIQSAIIVDIGPFSYFDREKYTVTSDTLKQIIGLSKIKMKKTTRNDIREAVGLLTQSKDVQGFFMSNVKSGDVEGDFEWRVNIDAVVNSYQSNLNFKPRDGWTFEGDVLVMAGTRSEYMERTEDYVKFKKCFPKIDLEKDIKSVDSGHWIHYEQPEWFLKEFEKFHHLQYFSSFFAKFYLNVFLVNVLL